MSSASWDFCGKRDSWASSHGLSAAMTGAECARRAARRAAAQRRLRHLATAAGALRAGGLDHALDAGQMRRQMAAVTRGLAGRFHALAPQRSLGPFLRSLEHTLGQFGIFQRQVELVRRQLFGALAKLFAL